MNVEKCSFYVFGRIINRYRHGIQYGELLKKYHNREQEPPCIWWLILYMGPISFIIYGTLTFTEGDP